jgi:hypothetical protein
MTEVRGEMERGGMETCLLGSGDSAEQRHTDGAEPRWMHAPWKMRPHRTAHSTTQIHRHTAQHSTAQHSAAQLSTAQQ